MVPTMGWWFASARGARELKSWGVFNNFYGIAFPSENQVTSSSRPLSKPFDPSRPYIRSLKVLSAKILVANAMNFPQLMVFHSVDTDRFV